MLGALPTKVVTFSYCYKSSNKIISSSISVRFSISTLYRRYHTTYDLYQTRSLNKKDSAIASGRTEYHRNEASLSPGYFNPSQQQMESSSTFLSSKISTNMITFTVPTKQHTTVSRSRWGRRQCLDYLGPSTTRFATLCRPEQPSSPR